MFHLPRAGARLTPAGQRVMPPIWFTLRLMKSETARERAPA